MVTAHPFDQKHCVGEVWTKSNKGERIYDQDKDFLHNSTLTLTLDIETWF